MIHPTPILTSAALAPTATPLMARNEPIVAPGPGDPGAIALRGVVADVARAMGAGRLPQGDPWTGVPPMKQAPDDPATRHLPIKARVRVGHGQTAETPPRAVAPHRAGPVVTGKR